MAKKKSNGKIKEVVESMKPIYEEIKQHEDKKDKEDTTNRDDYKYWIIKLIDILEKTGEKNEELYNLIVETYPSIKDILDELIQEVDLFTIYEDEPSVANMNYEAYLIKIKEIIEQN